MSDTIIVTGVIDLDPAKRDEAVAAVTECTEATPPRSWIPSASDPILAAGSRRRESPFGTA